MRWMIAAPLLLLFHGCDAKIAFLFISRGSLPLSSVWERFFAPVPPEAYTILVHTPPGGTPLSFEKPRPLLTL